MERYQVTDRSESGHCCFSATVVDTSNTDTSGSHDIVCECFDVDDANRIAEALNNQTI